MRRNFLDRHLRGILFDQILDGPNSHSAFLCRIEESVLMTETRNNAFSDLKIIEESALDLVAEIHDCLVAAFSDDSDPVIPKINVLDIKADTL